MTGVAWETGVLAGLAELGVDLTEAERFVGTSAGSVVAVQLACGTPLTTLLAHQLTPPSTERSARLGP